MDPSNILVTIEQNLSHVIEVIDGWLWGWPLLILLGSCHVFLTFRLKFIQRYIPLGIKLSLTPDKSSKGDISHFGALAIALAATIGTGNIIGVSTAVVKGGPGAVFWCWLFGVFGIATKYAEAVASVKFRIHDADGKCHGGPMYAIERGMHCKWLAVLFAIFTILACFGIGNMVQSNAVSTSAVAIFKGLKPWHVGLAEAAFIAAVVLGGLRWISRLCEALVPFMAVLYVVGCLIVIGCCSEFFLPAIKLILTDAFSMKAVGGGFLGTLMMMALRFGVARGLFSNESGMGSAPIVAANAQTKNPVRQALISSTGTFWDTVIICAITGITVVSSGLAAMNEAKNMPAQSVIVASEAVEVIENKSGEVVAASEVIDVEKMPVAANAERSVNEALQEFNNRAAVALNQPVVPGKVAYWGDFEAQHLIQGAFSHIPHAGKYILLISLIIFGYTTILGWYCYGVQAFHYLGGNIGMMIFRPIFIIGIFFGAVFQLNMVWNFSDIANGLMAIPNMICLFALSGVIAKETSKYLWHGSIDTPDPECVDDPGADDVSFEDMSK